VEGCKDARIQGIQVDKEKNILYPLWFFNKKQAPLEERGRLLREARAASRPYRVTIQIPSVPGPVCVPITGLTSAT
jgi:hypothetical protein